MASKTKEVDELAELKDIPKEVLSLTFDQLRTLLCIKAHGSPGKAASVLGREQSSVSKQLDTMNRGFDLLCGEKLALERGRGKDYVFTGTGNLVADLAKGLFATWNRDLEKQRRKVGKRLVVATTTFTLPILANYWKTLTTLVDDKVELKVEHIRTNDFWENLNRRHVDVVVGGVVAAHGQPPDLPECDFLEITRDSFCVLTNIPEHRFPGKTVSREDFKKHLVALPEGGVIMDAVHNWYPNDYESAFRGIFPIRDVHYGLTLLQTSILEGFIFSTSFVAQEIENRKSVGPNETEGMVRRVQLRRLQLGPDFVPLDLVVGLCARFKEREGYAAERKNHPLAVLWSICEEHVNLEKNKHAENRQRQS